MSSTQKEGISPVKAVPASSEEKSWIEHQRTEHQGTLKRLEDTAKYLSGLSSISLTIILAPNHDVLKTLNNTALLKAGIISWLLSILFTLVVVFPFRYHYIGNSADSIRSIHHKIAKLKFTFLVLGALLYLAGISLVVYLVLFFPH